MEGDLNREPVCSRRLRYYPLVCLAWEKQFREPRALKVSDGSLAWMILERVGGKKGQLGCGLREGKTSWTFQYLASTISSFHGKPNVLSGLFFPCYSKSSGQKPPFSWLGPSLVYSSGKHSRGALHQHRVGPREQNSPSTGVSRNDSTSFRNGSRGKIYNSNLICFPSCLQRVSTVSEG